MKKLIPLLLLGSFYVTAQAQDMPADSGVFLLHKFEQKIGKEVYRIHNNKIWKANDARKYEIDFKFVDRGSPVPLKATLTVTSPAFDPLELIIKGKTSRFSTVDDSIGIFGEGHVMRIGDKRIGAKTNQRILFPIIGYSPATVQQVLLQYWNNKKQPASINTLPSGSLQIKKDGIDKLVFNKKPVTFNRYIISGLIWGNELVWTDNTGKLICILTIDAEGDKTEIMREQYEPLLPELIKRAAGYGMAAFAKNAPAQAVVNKTIAITGGNILNVETGTITSNGILLLQNGKIINIGQVGTVTIPKGAQIIDATGKTVMPGLWDMHSHFEQTEWGPAYLAAGVTTVRDCGNELGFIDAIQKAIDSGKGIGPKILMAGIIDGKGPMSLGIIQADTKEEGIKAVDVYKAKGFDQIKVYSSMKPAVLKVVCDEAHRLGLTVTGHIPNGMNVRSGVDSGMNMVNHLQYVYSLMKKNKDRSIDFEDTTTQAVIRFLKEHKTVIDPTIGVYELSYFNAADDITKMEPAFYTLPLPLQNQFKSYGVDSATANKLKPMLNSMKVLVKKLYDAGVPVVAGTDMGFPGFSVARELEIYVEGGLTAAEALRTATIIPAQVMGLDKKTGSIAEGKNADIIIIQGNPLTNMRDIRNVRLVIKGGKIYDPSTLHKMVGFSK